MKKRNGIIVLILAVILTALLIITSAVGWGPTGTGAVRNIKTGLDLSGGVSITYATSDPNPSSEDMSDTIYKLQQRVDQYSTESQVYSEGTNRINVEIPGVSNADEILQDLGTPGSLYFISQTDDEGNSNYTYSNTGYILNYSIDELKEKGSIVCEGSDVAEAVATTRANQTTGVNEYVVNLRLNENGAKAFAEATKKAYSNGESIAIYYDGQFVSVPNVKAVINDGNCEISGQSTMEEANRLASFIRIGGLKLELNELRSNVVGASLGQEAIKTSLIGGAIGLAIVCIIMIVVYLVPGVIASFALILYTAIMLLLLNAFDLTLTLPGIAGIILSIGMAVDANVIIYARIQEEINAGSTVKGAIKSGFNKAMSAILDGNITTLIAAAVLGWLGSGSVKGFAMTLALGVVLSMFTALVISRLLVNAVYAVGVENPRLWARTKKVKVLSFVRHRVLFFVISTVLVLSGFVAMAVNSAGGKGALNLSLDFVGGTNTTVEFAEDYSLEELDEIVKPVVMEVTGDADVSMQKVVGGNQVIIKTRDLNADERVELSDKLVNELGVNEETITAESISSTISSEMRRDAVVAVIIAIVLMLLYIWIRFKDIRFASSAVIALAHDVLIVLASYAIVRISVGSTFIACMLTILGYSINATIVIFDRIRENTRGIGKKVNMEEIVNRSISQTLTRSIFTTLTTFVTICALYVVGVSSIKEFALPLMVGIIAGGWSSVCITGTLWHFMKAGKLPKLQASVGVLAVSENDEAAPEEASEEVKTENKSKNPNVIRKKKNKKHTAK
ncbi:MAG: protein translocase subunit SecD [Lachnospiraceae bacterium]